MGWESAEKVQKNDAGEFRAMIGGEWVPVAKAQKSDAGEYRVDRGAPAPATGPVPVSKIPGMEGATQAGDGEKKEPSDFGVAVNAANKGFAAIPDALLNAPTHLLNLGKAAYGTAATAMGRPDLAPNITQPPNFVHRAVKAAGGINENYEPQNTRQRVIDTIAQSGTGSLGSPVNSARQIATNLGTGAVGGAAGGTVNEATGNENAGMLASMLTPAAVQGAGIRGRQAVAAAVEENNRNSVRNKTLNDARDEGYVVAPSSVNPSFINGRLESIAGGSHVKQDAAHRNQIVTNVIAARELGLPKDTAITEGVLENFRKQRAEPYRQIAAIDQHAATTLEELQKARFTANEYNKFYDRSGDPKARETAEVAAGRAKVLEAALEQMAVQSGSPKLVIELREARRDIAKSYDIDRSLNLGDAGVSAPSLGRAYDRGTPLTGGLETSAKFALGPGRQFTAEGSSVPAPNVTRGDMYGMAGIGAGGAAVLGPAGAALGVLPLIRGPVRNLVLSPAYQRLMASGEKSAGVSSQLAAGIPELSKEQTALQMLLLSRAAQNQGDQR